MKGKLNSGREATHPGSHSKLGAETEESLQCCGGDGVHQYVDKNDGTVLFCFVQWGDKSLGPEHSSLSPCFALCGLDMATLSVPWGWDKVALCSGKGKVLHAGCFTGREDHGGMKGVLLGDGERKISLESMVEMIKMHILSNSFPKNLS